MQCKVVGVERDDLAISRVNHKAPHRTSACSHALGHAARADSLTSDTLQAPKLHHEQNLAWCLVRTFRPSNSYGAQTRTCNAFLPGRCTRPPAAGPQLQDLHPASHELLRMTAGVSFSEVWVATGGAEGRLGGEACMDSKCLHAAAKTTRSQAAGKFLSVLCPRSHLAQMRKPMSNHNSGPQFRVNPPPPPQTHTHTHTHTQTETERHRHRYRVIAAEKAFARRSALVGALAKTSCSCSSSSQVLNSSDST